MNPYSIAILIALFVKFVLFLTATFLNIVNIIRADYSKIKQSYTYSEFSRACLYTKAKSRTALIRNFVSTVLLMLFWLLSGFHFLDELVRSISQSNVVRGTIFISALMLMYSIVRFIYSAYLTFVTEQRFGFNSTTIKTFMLDKLKSLALYFSTALPILYLLLSLFEIYGTYTWWIAWIIISAVAVIIEMILPQLMLRFFYQAKPIEHSPIENIIYDYCQKIKFPINNIFVVDGSKRTSKVNAYFTGFGKTKAIVLYDNILENFTDSEILCIIGHEAGHFKLNHNLKNTIFGITFAGLVLFLFNIFIGDFRLFSGFFVYNFSFYSGIVFFTILYSVADIFLSPIIKAYRRRIERQADQFSVLSTKDKESMISALKKLSIKNLVNPLPHPVYVTLYYSQFPIEQRIKAIEDITEK